jgi:hypothetical protein
MIEKRNKKLELKQKVRALIERNAHLLKVAPKNKKLARRRLEVNKRNLKHEQELILMKIQHLEEDIVRKGCPGIHLRD